MPTAKSDIVPELGQAFYDRKDLEDKSSTIDSDEREILRTAVIDYERIDYLATDVLGYELKKCHQSMLLFQASNNKVLILAPRGIGKSTICTVIRAIFELVLNPNIRILIVSNTSTQAKVFLREIKSQIESNEQFINVFGNLVGRKWDSEEIDISTRTSFAKEANVTCLGVGSGVIGRHYDLILGDDLVDEENSRTEAQRTKFKTWFYKVLDPCLEPDGRVYIHGTRYYPSDHYGHLIKGDDEYVHTVYPALNKDETETLWPEKMSIKWLLSKRKSQGTAIFNTQYQNDTKTMEGKIFKYEWIKYYDILPDNLMIFQGVDLAISKTSQADYFCIATIGKDEFGRIFLIDIYKNRLSFLQQSAMINDKWEQYRARRVFVESNVYQMAQAELLMALTDIPVRPVITIKDKITRAWSLSSKFENGNVLFPRYGVQEFIDNLIEFPDCDHDDDIDAFMIAVESSSKRIRKKRREFGIL